jgi:hypothetical protein
MKTKLAICLIALTVSAYGQKAQTRPATPDQHNVSARYQLVSFEFSDQGAISRNVFLLDSQTGRVWRYQALGVIGNKDEPISIPELFIPVQILQPKEGVKISPDEN